MGRSSGIKGGLQDLTIRMLIGLAEEEEGARDRIGQQDVPDGEADEGNMADFGHSVILGPSIYLLTSQSLKPG